MISISNLWLRYRNGDWVLRGVDLHVGQGEAVLLTGPNGSGKTTVARLLAGLIPSFYPAELRGRVHVAGVDLLDDPEGLAGKVGYVAQDPDTQILALTVLDEAAYPLLARGLEPPEAERRAMETLRNLGMERMAERSTFMLSSGEAQKTALAASLSYRPQLLVLDEPLTYLDSESSRIFVDALLKAKKMDITIVIIEQDVEPVLDIIDKAIILDSGRTTVMDKDSFLKQYREGLLSDLIPTRPQSSRVCRNDSIGGKPAVTMENVWYKYPRSDEHVLRGISLSLAEKTVNVLMGPNGAGKTTLLKIMAGILKPSTGSVKGFFRKAFYVPQNPLLALNGPTVQEEVESVWQKDAVYTPSEALRIMGLQELRHIKIMHLSHGQRRRLAIASALASGADILLLDEPTAGLDAWARRELPGHLRRVVEAGVTIVMATHDKGLASEAADHLILLEEGRIRGSGPPCIMPGEAGSSD